MGAKFSGGGATVFHDRTDSPGEITTSLINSTDGAGLHFDGSSGSIDIASPPDLGTKFSFEFVVQADSWLTDEGSNYLIDFYKLVNEPTTPGARFILGGHINAPTAGTSSNLGIYDHNIWHSFGVKVLDDLKVHHIVVTIDGTAAILYDNGNQVGTLTVGTGHNIDDSTDLAIGSNFQNSGSRFNGTMYRARLWNKTLEQADVTSVYESASLDYADQWGSQTELVTNGTFTGSTTSWHINRVAYGTNDVDWVSGNYSYIRQLSWVITEGKKYRLTFDVSAYSAGGVLGVWDYNGTAGNIITTLDSIAGNGTITHEFTALKSSSSGVLFGTTTATNTFVGTMTNVSCVEIGCVADYDLSYANPTQSNIVRNRNDTVTADGTAAGGVVQITKLEAVNTNKLSVGGTTPLVGIGLAAGTPPDHLLHMANANGESLLKLQRIGDNDGIASFNIGGSVPGFNLVVSGTSGDFTVATGGAERMRIDSSGNSTFSGTVVSSASASGTVREIAVENTATGASSSARMRIKSGVSGGTSVGDAYTQYTDSLNFNWSVGAGSTGSRNLIFAEHYTLGTNERMRLSSTGLAVTGATTSTGGFDGTLGATTPATVAATTIAASGDVTLFGDNSSTPLTVNGGTASLASIQLNGGTSATDNSSIRSKYSLALTCNSTNAIPTRSIVFNNGTTQHLKIDSTGLATFSSGIAFQTTGTGTGTSSEAFTLDKYETGDWSPVLATSTGATTTSANWTATGKYTRTGNVVTVWFMFTSLSTAIDDLAYNRVTGLPFANTMSELASNTALSRIHDFTMSNTAYYMSVSASEIVFHELGSGNADVTFARINAQQRLSGSATYLVA